MALVRNIEEQKHLIECMRDIVMSMNNESAYDMFILTYPDGADEEDIAYMAEDAEQFDDIASAFFKVCKAYGKDGLCTLDIVKD